MKGRYKSVTPVTDFSTSQKIRVALIDAGNTDLAIESITEPIRDLEAECGNLKNRIVALEQERTKWMTESGVFRTIQKHSNKAVVTWVTWVARGAVVTIGSGILGLAWKGLWALVKK